MSEEEEQVTCNNCGLACHCGHDEDCMESDCGDHCNNCEH